MRDRSEKESKPEFSRKIQKMSKGASENEDKENFCFHIMTFSRHLTFVFLEKENKSTVSRTND